MGIGKKLNGTFRKFIQAQQMFFVATAAPDGRVNLSPKGLDSLRILDDNRVIWLSLSGSGNETAAHLLENPRMTLMFMALQGDPLILRLYGTAKALHPGDQGWDEHLARFPKMAGSRNIYDMDVDLVQTSCGSGVPIYDYQGQRGVDELVPFYEEMGPEGVEAYWQRKNKLSIDGKPTGL